MMHTINSPTMNISHILGQWIRSMFNEQFKANSIIDGDQLIKRLPKQADNGHRKPTTSFHTFDINISFAT